MEKCTICQTEVKSEKIFFRSVLCSVCTDCSKTAIKNLLIKEVLPAENVVKAIAEQVQKNATFQQSALFEQTKVSPHSEEAKHKKDYPNGRIFTELNKRNSSGVAGVCEAWYETNSGRVYFWKVFFSYKKSFLTGQPIKVQKIFKDFESAVKARLQLELIHHGRDKAAQKHLFKKYGI